MNETTEVTEITEEGHGSALTYNIINAAIEVHRLLGPGLLEKAYESCLSYELTLRGLKVEAQKEMSLAYKNLFLEGMYRLDLLVNNEVVIEIKSVSEISPVHKAQILSYMKISGYKLGLLINFNTTILKKGIKRFCL